MEWQISSKPVDYLQAVEAMEQRISAILAGKAPELVWLLEHPPLYTSGTSAQPDGLVSRKFPVYDAGRGGEWTYHGPGQRIAYIMLDLKKRDAMDVRAYVKNLEQWLIATLAQLGVKGEVRDGRIGVWVKTRDGEAKIAAMGIRVRKWITYHGISLNVNPDLSHYAGIVPCGIREYGVTSLAALGVKATMEEVDTALKETFEASFAR